MVAMSTLRRLLPAIAPLVLLLAAPAPASAQGGQALHADVAALYPDLEALYRDLHSHPELAFQETRTAATLAARLRTLGYDVTAGVGKTGIVALLKNGAGPTVMLRSELDALPVAEATGVPFASTVRAKNPAGQEVPVMHACGHDLHMAALVGTAQWMAAHRDRWRGTLMLVGQPAEETVGGAAAMLEDGLFTRFPKPQFAISLHDDDTMPAGTIGIHPGLFRSASGSPTITIYGRGGHGAMPHNTVDPVVIAARVVLALQTIVSREVNPLDPAVITVGSIHGGTQGNIIPDEVTLQLTVRTFRDEVRTQVRAAIERTVKAEAQAAGSPREPRIVWGGGTDAVYNDPALAGRMMSALRATLGADRVVEMPAKMTSEDFSQYGRAGVPSVLMHIGAVPAEALAGARRSGVPLDAPHSPRWLPELKPTLTGAVVAEVATLLDLLRAD
jgi:amidohydrolase